MSRLRSRTGFRPRVVVEARELTPVRRAILGQDVAWLNVSAMSALWQRSSPGRALAEWTRPLAPPSVRMGVTGIDYNWTGGVGSLRDRVEILDPHTRRSVLLRFGTDELLALCAATGASPWLQIGLTGVNPRRTGEWARYWSSHGLPVPHWELGSLEQFRESGSTPEDYTLAAEAHIEEIRKGVEQVAVGITLSPLGEQRPEVLSWDQAVIGQLGAKIDFVAVDIPPIGEPTWDVKDSERSAARATVAQSAILQDLLDERQTLLDSAELPPLPMAITGWGPGPLPMSTPSAQRDTIETPASTAAMINAMLREPRLQSAHFRTLVDAGPGACLRVRDDGVHPTHLGCVFELYGAALGTSTLGLQVTTETRAAVEEISRPIPLLDALATRDETGAVALFLVNRSVDRPQTVDLDVDRDLRVGPRATALSVIPGEPFDDLGKEDGEAAVLPGPPVRGDGPWAVEVPPGALTAVLWQAPTANHPSRSAKSLTAPDPTLQE